MGNAENPMKMYLKNARLSLGGDNKLMVVLEDGLASDYFKGEAHEQNKQQLEAVIVRLFRQGDRSDDPDGGK